MDIYRLNQEELVYELAVRGMAPGTCDEMRKVLARAKKLEKTGDSFSYPDHPFTFDEDDKAVKKDLQEVGTEHVDDSDGGSVAKKLETRLTHLFRGVDRMVPKNDEERTRKTTLAIQVMLLLSEAEEKVALFTERKKKGDLPPTLSMLEEQGIQQQQQREPMQQRAQQQQPHVSILEEFAGPSEVG